VKPAAFDYERPASLDAATRLLAEPGVFSKVVAGSQSLGPMLNLRLAQPELLVDITSIAELLAAVAGRIAYRAVRNRGTVGGSLAHADPAADWISVFPLLGAEVVTRARGGARLIAAEKLMVSSFITVLQPDELIRAIRVPKLSARARWGFSKFNQKAGEFAHAIGGMLHDPDRGRFRAVIGAIETAPIIVPDATTLFGGPFGAGMADRLDERAVLGLLDGRGVRDDYTRQLLLVVLKRAARQASAS
jgi:carbon-monoxide dehydrogenase medium subunit